VKFLRVHFLLMEFHVYTSYVLFCLMEYYFHFCVMELYGVLQVSQRILKDRKYTFVVDDDAGELQLGTVLVAVYCSVMQFVVVCCRVLQCAIVCGL